MLLLKPKGPSVGEGQVNVKSHLSKSSFISIITLSISKERSHRSKSG